MPKFSKKALQNEQMFGDRTAFQACQALEAVPGLPQVALRRKAAPYSTRTTSRPAREGRELPQLFVTGFPAEAPDKHFALLLGHAQGLQAIRGARKRHMG